MPVERTHAPFFQFQLPRWPFRLSYIQKCHEREKWYSILAIEHSISSILLASTMMTRYAILFDFGAHNDSIIPEICLQLHSVKITFVKFIENVALWRVCNRNHIRCMYVELVCSHTLENIQITSQYIFHFALFLYTTSIFVYLYT